jgi:hypothetical protein
MTTTNAAYKPADFDEFAPGDRIRFVTNDNGYGGAGNVWRTGTVDKITAKSLIIDCDDNRLGARARVRRADWSSREPQRGAPAGRTPYDAQHVKIVDDGPIVTALWIPNPEQVKNPRRVLDNITDRALHDGVEVVATARRFYRYEGADFSGWIVERGPQDYSEPIPNKREAMASLRHSIRAYFQR